MLVMRGWGGLPVLLLIPIAMSTLVTTDERMLSFIFGAGLLLDAALSWIVGRKHHARVDQGSGRPPGFRRFLDQGLFNSSAEDISPDYSLVYVRLEYWAFPLLLAAIAVVTYGFGLPAKP